MYRENPEARPRRYTDDSNSSLESSTSSHSTAEGSDGKQARFIHIYIFFSSCSCSWIYSHVLMSENSSFGELCFYIYIFDTFIVG